MVASASLLFFLLRTVSGALRIKETGRLWTTPAWAGKPDPQAQAGGHNWRHLPRRDRTHKQDHTQATLLTWGLQGIPNEGFRPPAHSARQPGTLTLQSRWERREFCSVCPGIIAVIAASVSWPSILCQALHAWCIVSAYETPCIIIIIKLMIIYSSRALCIKQRQGSCSF